MIQLRVEEARPLEWTREDVSDPSTFPLGGLNSCLGLHNWEMTQSSKRFSSFKGTKA